MREIKFRAWIEKAGQMASWENMKKQCDRLSLLEMPGFIIMQYTGLKDKNGKEIYEGDVIKITYGKEDKRFGFGKGMITDVYFDKGAFRYRHDDNSGSVLDFNSAQIIKGYESITQDVEIIGNIHENPELLKSK
jgi:uncharacterized phage protein (TIGR01671 family)